MILLSVLLAVTLAAIHLFGQKITRYHIIPRSSWLSIAGGASIAYVFVHLLPELAERQHIVQEAAPPPLLFLEHHVFLAALFGLAFFYGLEQLASKSRREQHDDTTPRHVFAVHLGSFGVYNLLIGYLLVHLEDPSLYGRLSYFFAMGLHFFVNDNSLRRHHREQYMKPGRFILAAAVLIGWGVGFLTEIHQAPLALLFSFLAGSIILNVIKEELPGERESRFWAFLAGAGAYLGVILFFQVM
jgi:hypothetical protein